MAGTRGINTLRGAQLRNRTLRDNHFDVNHKINEDKVNIKWHEHREILEDTKVDVFVQANNQSIAGLQSLDVTTLIGSTAVSTNASTEGIVDGAKVELRLCGTQGTPMSDTDGDTVYGKMRYDNSSSKFYVDFYSLVDGEESAYTFAESAENVDIAYIQRTNLSVLPVDAIVKGGAGFVEGATDAKAYMNLVQLMKDIYGATGTLDNDGNANLSTNIIQQIAEEIQNRIDGDQAIRDDLVSNGTDEGASLIGVVGDSNYDGTTVQEVLSDIASRVTTIVTTIETEDEREVFEASGGETSYILKKGTAKPNTLFLSINGSLQVPGLHYEEIINAEGNINGVVFAPDALIVENGVPDNVFVWYKKVL